MDALMNKDSLLQLSEAINEMSLDETQSLIDDAVKCVQSNIDNKEIEKIVTFLYNILLCTQLDKIHISSIDFSNHKVCLDKIAFIKGVELKNNIDLLLESTPSYENYGLAGALFANSSSPEIESHVLSQIKRDDISAESQIFLISVASNFLSKETKHILKERLTRLIEQTPTELMVLSFGIMKFNLSYTCDLANKFMLNCINYNKMELITKLLIIVNGWLLNDKDRDEMLLKLFAKCDGYVYEENSIKNQIFHFFDILSDKMYSPELNQLQIFLLGSKSKFSENIMDQAINIIQDKNSDLELLFLSLNIVKPNSYFVSILTNGTYPDFIRREAARVLLKYSEKNLLHEKCIVMLTSFITSTTTNEFLEPVLDILENILSLYYQKNMKIPDCVQTIMESQHNVIKSYGLLYSFCYKATAGQDQNVDEFIRLFIELFSEETAKPLVDALSLYVRNYPQVLLYFQPILSKAFWIVSHRPQILSMEITKAIPYGMVLARKLNSYPSKKVVTKTEYNLYISCFKLIFIFIKDSCSISMELFDRALQCLLLNKDLTFFNGLKSEFYYNVLPHIYPKLTEVPQSFIDFVLYTKFFSPYFDFSTNNNEQVKNVIAKASLSRVDEMIAAHKLKESDIVDIIKQTIVFDQDAVLARTYGWADKIKEKDPESSLIPVLVILCCLEERNEEEIGTSFLDYVSCIFCDHKCDLSTKYVEHVITSLEVLFSNIKIKLSAKTIQSWLTFFFNFIYDEIDDDFYQNYLCCTHYLIADFLKMSDEIQTLDNLSNYFSIFSDSINEDTVDLFFKYLRMEDPEYIDLKLYLQRLWNSLDVSTLKKVGAGIARYVAKNAQFIDTIEEIETTNQREKRYYQQIISYAKKIIQSQN